MKFDSYQRFIRSDLYKKCLEAESKNQPLPYPGDQLDELLRTTPNSPGPSKLKNLQVMLRIVVVKVYFLGIVKHVVNHAIEMNVIYKVINHQANLKHLEIH